MAKDHELERLRAEALARHAAAGKKISRNRAKGIEISGSPFDIRREVSRIKRYNKAQLNAYIYELMGFTSRKTQFVAGAEGKPIPVAKLREAEAVRQRYNKMVANRAKGFNDIVEPVHNQTIAELNENRPRKRAKGEASSKQFGERAPINPAHINGAAALDKITAYLKRKMTRQYSADVGKLTRKRVNALLKGVGDISAMEKAHKLTNFQLDVLFNENPSFAEALALDYDIHKKIAESKSERQHQRQQETAEKEIHALLDWAKSLPRRPNK